MDFETFVRSCETYIDRYRCPVCGSYYVQIDHEYRGSTRVREMTCLKCGEEWTE
jgi:translation initiation factor 2 beta subunit (eIF-2beta)/eIF-5